MKQNIKLHIEELVLHGFERIDRFRIGAAIEGELIRLLNEQGVPSLFSHNGEFARMDHGTFNLAPNAKAEAIGSQVARQVYGGLGK